MYIYPLKIKNIVLYCIVQWRYSGFQVTGMIEWGQKSKPKKIPRPRINPPKMPSQIVCTVFAELQLGQDKKVLPCFEHPQKSLL